MKVLNKIKILLMMVAVVALLLALMQAIHTYDFIERAEKAQAQVIALEENNFSHPITLRFVTQYQTQLDVKTEMLSPVSVGDTVELLYNRLIPAQVKINVFPELWLSVLLSVTVMLAASFFAALISGCCRWNTNRLKKLKRNSNHIYTKFKTVKSVIQAEAGERKVYQIVSTWFDQRARKTYEFKSKYLWKDPIDYMMDQTIKVMIDSKNKNKYSMDLSFLPDNLKKCD